MLFRKLFEGEKLTRNLQIMHFQIVSKFMLNSKVIFRSIIDTDDTNVMYGLRFLNRSIMALSL